ncbi:hypothetical protein [Methanococcus maripaludis]|uniref:Uncharacterized protein n=1 Tax=Methanococcus maripaludis TaxID=39152 RepID=A0A8T4H5H8_METMI|nr:hypothetical protein [Methanococcus maripaludis]MBP2219005.1 hypothetical protein [Methanococcus maripaludis]
MDSYFTAIGVLNFSVKVESKGSLINKKTLEKALNDLEKNR